MKKYINCKYENQPTETIDELDSSEFESMKEFKKELRFLFENTRVSQPQLKIWISSRPTNEWKNR